MLGVSTEYWCGLSKLFKIAIICSLLSACVSHVPAPVYDRSTGTGSGAESTPKTYVVVAGDTLFSIAWRYNLKYADLAKYNGISYPYLIKPRQTIRLDLPRNYVSAPSSLKSPKLTSARPIPRVTPTQNATKSVGVQSRDRSQNRTSVSSPAPKIPANMGAPKWRWPVGGPVLSRFQGSTGLNKGIDLGGKLGEPVVSAAEGVVVYAGSGLRGYGKLLIIKHDEVFLSAYAHNDRLRVKEGDQIKAGDVIADMGSSGTDKVKLHFEIRRDGVPVDPLAYLPKR